MAGPNPILTKNVVAGAAITGKRLLKLGSADDTLIQAVDDAAPILGAAQYDAASGKHVDVDMMGLVTVVAGGTVTRGDPVTADANGKAVSSAPGAGVNAWIAGIAMASAVADDEFEILLAPGRIQG